MYKKGFTEIEDMLMREHKAEGGRLGEEMREKEEAKKPMPGKKMMGKGLLMKRMMVKKPMEHMRMAKEPNMENMKKGGKSCRMKKASGGKEMAFKKPEMLLNAKRTGFAAGAIGKVRKGEY